MRSIFITLALLLFSFVGCIAQRATCPIRGVQFGCPSKYFKEIKVDSTEVRIFKYVSKGNTLFFFMSSPAASFDLETLGKLVLSTYTTAANQPVQWKTERNPLFMEMQTKYKYDLNAYLGLTQTKLFEVKAFSFTVKEKKVVLGYITDESESRSSNRAVFERGEGNSDNAAGCNAVATALNSITKEFRDKEQGCVLTALQS